MPQPKKHKVINRKPAFLAAFRATLQLNLAVKAAGIGMHTHYDWLKSDPQYRIDYEQARNDVAQKFEDEAFNRAMNGVKRALYYRGKPVLKGKTRSHVYEVEYNDNLLLAVLKRLRPDDWRERISTEVTGSLDLIERIQEGRKRLLEMKREDDGNSVAS